MRRSESLVALNADMKSSRHATADADEDTRVFDLFQALHDHLARDERATPRHPSYATSQHGAMYKGMSTRAPFAHPTTKKVAAIVLSL